MIASIGFYGLGLMGGSIARALRNSCPEIRLFACDPDRSSLAQALQENVIDGVCEETDARLADRSSSRQIRLLSDRKKLP